MTQIQAPLPPERLRSWLDERSEVWADALGQLVALESPSGDPGAIGRCEDLVAELANRWVPGVMVSREAPGGVPGLSLTLEGDPGASVLLLCHLDTVWEAGAFSGGVRREGRRMTGPGVFDMKGGVVVGLAAMAVVAEHGRAPGKVTLLCTGDEEVGSTASRPTIEQAARESSAVLVLEPPADGALKVGRKGVGTYRLRLHGRAAHAGLEPELGVNAVAELARLVGAVGDLGDPEVGTTVTPTVFRGGGRVNVVPELAELEVDVRFATSAEATRVDRGLRQLKPRHPDATLELGGGPNRPPLETAAAADLFAVAKEVGSWLGLPPIQGVTVGGGSDGNFTAALGVPTLDGLGVVGGSAHAPGEWADLGSLPERGALVAGCLWQLGATRGST
ncbi:MAG: M20/M25/M40 family metallo-hydrolase [Candidatus Dormibacteria bacterium]